MGCWQGWYGVQFYSSLSPPVSVCLDPYYYIRPFLFSQQRLKIAHSSFSFSQCLHCQPWGLSALTPILASSYRLPLRLLWVHKCITFKAKVTISAISLIILFILKLITTTISIVMNLVANSDRSNGVMLAGCFQSSESNLKWWDEDCDCDFAAIFQGFQRCLRGSRKFELIIGGLVYYGGLRIDLGGVKMLIILFFLFHTQMRGCSSLLDNFCLRVIH